MAQKVRDFSSGFVALFCFISVFLFSVEAESAEFDWHGFAQANTSVRYPSSEEKKDFMLGEGRFQLQLSGSNHGGRAGFSLKTDFFYDSVKSTTKPEIREGYVDYYGKMFDVRVGRQIITWGTGDLLFINDLFPKDWEAFFTGKPMEYMKIGSDAVKVNFYHEAVNLELAIIPFFKEDNLPSSENFFMYNPFADLPQKEEMPDKAVANVELAMRLSRSIAGSDASLYVYRGYWPVGAGHPDDASSPSSITLKYPELAVYGLSLQGNFATGILNLEGGYYDSRDDKSGVHPYVPNSEWRYLLGYQKQVDSDTIISFQYYGELMANYKNYKNNVPAGFPAKKENHQYITFRVTRFFMYQTLKISMFSYYSPDEEDYYIIPDARYTLSDGMWLAVGANIFGGKKQTTFFGQFNKNDNIYAVIRYEF